MAQAIQIPITILGYKEAKAQLDALNLSIDNNNDATKDQIKTQKELKDALEKTDEAVVESAKQTEKLTDMYVRNEDGMLEVSATISKLEDKMYSLAIAGESNSDEFKNLQKETAKFKKVVIDTDKSIDTLAENQGLGQVGVGLGNVGDRLLSLDFAGAGREAQQMSNNMSNLSNIGSTAIKGMTQTVTGLSKAFIKMGIALLTNPIFLIVAAFVLIGAAIVGLLSKLGLLQPILDAIGKVLGWIGDVIDAVVQSFKDFSDWLGFTTLAADEMTKGQIENSEKMRAANTIATTEAVAQIDHELRIRQAAGESTIDLELEKQRVIKEGARVQIELLNEEIKGRIKLGDITKEEADALKKSVKDQLAIITTSNREIEAINTTHNATIKAANKESYQKQLDDLNTHNNNRLAATQLIQDLEIEIMKDGESKSLEQNNIKYSRLIEETIANETLLQEEKLRIIALYEQIQNDNAQLIRNKANEDNAIKLELKTQELTNEGDQLLNFYTVDLNNHTTNEEAKTEKTKEENDKRKADVKAAINGGFEAASKSLNSLSELNSFLGDKKLAKLKKGSAAEEKQMKKTFEMNKKIQIAQAVIQGVQSVLAAYSSGAAIPIIGAVTGPLFAGLAAVSAGINIAKIKNSKFEGGGSSPSAPSPTAAPTVTPPKSAASPSLSLFGQANDQNNLEEVEANESGNQITVNAVVSETEITETQNNVKNIQENAEL